MDDLKNNLKSFRNEIARDTNTRSSCARVNAKWPEANWIGIPSGGFRTLTCVIIQRNQRESDKSITRFSFLFPLQAVLFARHYSTIASFSNSFFTDHIGIVSCTSHPSPRHVSAQKNPLEIARRFNNAVSSVKHDIVVTA